jgi:hypothetical protein
MTTFTTDDRENAMKKEAWEVAYDDWVALLNTANAKELLQDPSACFDEAWRQATMVITQIVTQQLSEDDANKVNTAITRKMLK